MCRPSIALAAYAVIAYMDTVVGVWLPARRHACGPGGAGSGVAEAGVEFRGDHGQRLLERSGSRVTAPRTHTGDRIACDAVILTTDCR